MTLSKAAGLAGSDPIYFKEILKDRGIKVEVQVNYKEKLEEKSRLLDE